MFGRLNRLVVAAFLAGAVFAAPTTALASGCGGGPSAVNVYKECLPTGGGGNSSGGSSKSASGGSSKTSSGGPVSSTSTTPPTVSSPAAKALRHAGKDRRALAGLLAGHSHPTLLGSGPSGETSAPSAMGSAFDLGSGPTALLIVLAGTAALIFGGSGVRLWRHRHHS